tara:strand:- start:55565 stop:57202 length:1638 start_codon:yes stop_codon:yes gene_type:complete
MRSDVIKVYKDVHTWVGIISGLALFIAFYAGAITMFEAPLQQWSSPPSKFESFTPLDRTAELIDKVTARYPEAATGYQIVLEPTTEYPARMNWRVQVAEAHDHDPPTYRHADLSADGQLIVGDSGASPVSQLIDDLHRQIGLPFEHEIAMPIMGIIALLYGVALISGVIVLFPTLIKDLFAFRQTHNLKRMWLDFHNLLGLFSLPFHIIMAVTAVVFAFHDQFYDAQSALVYRGENSFTVPQRSIPAPVNDSASTIDSSQDQFLPPAQIVARLTEQAPGFTPNLMTYQIASGRGPMLRVFGNDPKYGMRSPTGGVVGVDPYTGEAVATDYMPGMQGPLGATLTSFFTLHFGSFGGAPVRWSYFILGLTGALLFYSGNLLWVETRRKKIRRNSAVSEVSQSRSTEILGALTVGVSLGCVAGISLTIAAAKLLPLWSLDGASWHPLIYYVVFLAAVAWALIRGAARGSVDLLAAAACATMMIPVVSLVSLVVPQVGWNYPDTSILVDVAALFATVALFLVGRRTAKRIKRAPSDSIWYAAELSHTAV